MAVENDRELSISDLDWDPSIDAGLLGTVMLFPSGVEKLLGAVA